MNDKERFHAIMGFERPDRVLYWEQGFWGGAVERWYAEGMPRKHGVEGDPAYGDTVRGPATPSVPGGKICYDVIESTGLDKLSLGVPVNLYLCPPFEEKILEKQGERLRVRDEMGIEKYTTTRKDSIPHFVSWPVQDSRDIEKLAEEQLDPESPERFPEDWEAQVERLNAYDGVVGLGGYPCGFFGSARFLMGEVALLMGFLDTPELVHRIMDHLADLWVSLYEKVLSRVKVDCIHIWEDMSFKNGPLISPELFGEFMVPAYRKVTDVARSYGVEIVLVDTDGDCTKLIPGFIEGGVTGLYPFEVQAGMDVKKIREAFPKLQIMGGVDKKEIASGRSGIESELARRIPGVLRRGGYIPMFDHQVPPDVSYDDYRYYRERLAEMAAAETSS